MRNAALVLRDQYDEVPVSSTEVLEANVASIRADLNELKVDFRAAVARIDSEIKSAVTKLEGEIRAAAAKAERDLQLFADRIEAELSRLRGEFADLRADNKSLREKVDSNFQLVLAENKEIRNAIGELTKIVIKFDSRQTAILWVGGGLATFITVAITVGKTLKWF